MRLRIVLMVFLIGLSVSQVFADGYVLFTAGSAKSLNYKSPLITARAGFEKDWQTYGKFRVAHCTL